MSIKIFFTPTPRHSPPPTIFFSVDVKILAIQIDFIVINQLRTRKFFSLTHSPAPASACLHISLHVRNHTLYVATLSACGKKAIVMLPFVECNMSLKLLPNISWLFADEKEVAECFHAWEKWKKKLMPFCMYEKEKTKRKRASERRKIYGNLNRILCFVRCERSLNIHSK
jgi:hypothetical protein